MQLLQMYKFWRLSDGRFLCQLGHASITTTLDRYVHLMPEVHREAAERLDDQLSGGFGRFIVEKEQKYEARIYNDFCNSLLLLVGLRGIKSVTCCLPDCFRFSFLFRVVS